VGKSSVVGDLTEPLNSSVRPRLLTLQPHVGLPHTDQVVADDDADAVELGVDPMPLLTRPMTAKSCRRRRVRRSFVPDGQDYGIDLTNESAAELSSAQSRDWPPGTRVSPAVHRALGWCRLAMTEAVVTSSGILDRTLSK